MMDLIRCPCCASRSASPVGIVASGVSFRCAECGELATLPAPIYRAPAPPAPRLPRGFGADVVAEA